VNTPSVPMLESVNTIAQHLGCVTLGAIPMDEDAFIDILTGDLGLVSSLKVWCSTLLICVSVWKIPMMNLPNLDNKQD